MSSQICKSFYGFTCWRELFKGFVFCWKCETWWSTPCISVKHINVKKYYKRRTPYKANPEQTRKFDSWQLVTHNRWNLASCQFTSLRVHTPPVPVIIFSHVPSRGIALAGSVHWLKRITSLFNGIRKALGVFRLNDLKDLPCREFLFNILVHQTEDTSSCCKTMGKSSHRSRRPGCQNGWRLVLTDRNFPGMSVNNKISALI